MKLPFENWIEKSLLSVDAKHLLHNSVICYKAGAPTAALLMGYLGFLVIVKNRMMSGNKPSLYPQPKWDKQILELQNEDKWEETIFNAVLQKENIDSSKTRTMDPVFVINDSMRNQIRYWKDRRNDCAHHKDNQIVNAHVEAFWAFLESSLPKITLEGGKATLLNKLARHYDTTYMPSNTDVTPIVQEILGSVEKADLQEFWKESLATVSDLFDYENETAFIDAVLKLNDDTLTESLLNYLKKDENLLKGYINERPTILGRLGFDEQDIRNFWKTKLLKYSNPIKVYASMLRTGMIPEAEISAANEKVASSYQYTQDANDHYVLAQHGFGEVLYHNLFIKKTAKDLKYWEFMNKHCALYVQYVASYPIKDEVVTILCVELAKTSWYPAFLQQAMNYFFKQNGVKKQEFITKAKALGLDLPGQVPELLI